MYAFSDPTSTGALERAGALAAYRERLDRLYDRFASQPDSAFTWIEAFEELSPGDQPQQHTVVWDAFPITAAASDSEIDTDRLVLQDEYVEWRVERDGDQVRSVTFTTEFPEYFEALAAASVDALKEEVATLIPGADPTDDELFGSGPDPAGDSPRNRAARFRRQLPRNPWNNGRRGILCLTQGANTLTALFGLLGACGVERPGVQPGEVCGQVGGACVDGRNSDPNVCTAAQQLVRAERSFTPADPAGIFMTRMKGNWQRGDAAFDINADPAWSLVRNGRRGTLTVSPDLRLNFNPIESGTVVSRVLVAASTVLSAADTELPDWARVGQEQFRGPIA